MRVLAALVLVFGLALAGGASFFAYKQYSAIQPLQGPETVEVIAANTRLDYGTRLTAENLMWTLVLKDTLPAGTFETREDLFGKDGTYVRTVMRTIEEGEPVVASRISEPNVMPRVAGKLSEGTRAFTIRIDAVTGVGGFVSPGDRVDVLLTSRENRQLVSSVILENITVIAVDQQSDTEAMAPQIGKTATVEVTPQQAQKLDLAQRLGKLSLTLRGIAGAVQDNADQMASDPDYAAAPITARDLLGSAATEPVEAEPVATVRVRKGTEVTEFVVD